MSANSEPTKQHHHSPRNIVILLRHGRSTANGAGVLAGRAAGVNLEDRGLEQAQQLLTRLSDTPISRIVSSPLERCQQTVTPLANSKQIPVEIDDRFAEVDYGQWTGRSLKDLGQEPLWATVQRTPSAAVFPGGEALAAVSARAVTAIREYVGDGTGSVTLVCSHGDVIKAIVADALGMHLDLFQRIVVEPGSLTVLSYGWPQPMVPQMNVTEMAPQLFDMSGAGAVGGATGSAGTPPVARENAN